MFKKFKACWKAFNGYDFNQLWNSACSYKFKLPKYGLVFQQTVYWDGLMSVIIKV